MNKQELSIVVVLFVLFFGWMILQPRTEPQKAADRNVSAVVTGEVSNVAPVLSTASNVASNTPVATVDDNAQVFDEVHKLPPAKTITLSNDVATVTILSRGAVIQSVALNEYKETIAADSLPILLDFHKHPALEIKDFPGFSGNDEFSVDKSQDGKSVRLTKDSPLGLRFERTISLSDGFNIAVKDTVLNTGSTATAVPEYAITTGPMESIRSNAKVRAGYAYLGIDSLASRGSSSVVYWAKSGPDDDKKSLRKRFSGAGRSLFGGGKSTTLLPVVKTFERKEDTDWVAVKNKFFVQIMSAEGGSSGLILNAKRKVAENEKVDDPSTWPSRAVLSEVSAAMKFSGETVNQGKTLTREISFYVGPKKYSAIKKLGNHKENIMFRAWHFFGWYRSLCVGMLLALNMMYKIIPNYGVAIILLTVAVKIIFWPFMRKSTESMQKMQKVQPELAVLKEKYKNDPKKMQQAQMELYKKHKINPLASCLPMFVQMPIFIGLYTVLRSAVELRFAGFMWIADLSEPEGLLAGSVPFIGELNVLPLLMTVTMVIQQKLTPTTGDAQQQKMMMLFMPVFMLFIMYRMPSALTLYWTINQVLSIVQLLKQRQSSSA